MNFRNLPTLVVLAVLAWAGPALAQSWVNGWWVYPYKSTDNKTNAFRPQNVNDRTLNVSDILIQAHRGGTDGFRIDTAWDFPGIQLPQSVAGATAPAASTPAPSAPVTNPVSSPPPAATPTPAAPTPAPPPATGARTVIDGRNGPQWPAADTVLRRRPWVAADDGGTMDIANIHILNVTNQKAMDIGLESVDRVKGRSIQFGTIQFRNILIENVVRNDAGRAAKLHLDGIRVAATTGNPAKMVRATNLYFDNVTIRNCYEAVPLLIQDGRYGTITFKNTVITGNRGNGGGSSFFYPGAQISTIGMGSIERIVIDGSPSFQINLFGRPGSIKEVVIRNSPGARVLDDPVPAGRPFAGQRSGARIIYENNNALKSVSTPTSTASASTSVLKSTTSTPAVKYNDYKVAYRTVNLNHLAVGRLTALSAALPHGIRIVGGGDRQDVPTTVNITDLDIQAGNGLPVGVYNGLFDKVTFKGIRSGGTRKDLYVSVIDFGQVEAVYVENCPNMTLSLFGRPGSIGTVYVKKSPGLRIQDVNTRRGKSGAKIVYVN